MVWFVNLDFQCYVQLQLWQYLQRWHQISIYDRKIWSKISYQYHWNHDCNWFLKKSQSKLSFPVERQDLFWYKKEDFLCCSPYSSWSSNTLSSTPWKPQALHHNFGSHMLQGILEIHLIFFRFRFLSFKIGEK